MAVGTIAAATIISAPSASAATVNISLTTSGSVAAGATIGAKAVISDDVDLPARLQIKLYNGANCSGSVRSTSRIFGQGDDSTDSGNEIRSGGGTFTYTYSDAPAGTYSFQAILDEDNEAPEADCSGSVVVGGGNPATQYRCGGLPATFVGSGLSETIYGTSGDDVIVARGGDDIVYGRGGNDRICGNAGEDILRGGSGNDIIRGGDNRDDIEGGFDNDTLVGDRGGDRLGGGPGNDRLYGGPGNDRLNGGQGTDFGSGGPGTDLGRSIEQV